MLSSYLWLAAALLDSADPERFHRRRKFVKMLTQTHQLQLSSQMGLRIKKQIFFVRTLTVLRKPSMEKCRLDFSMLVLSPGPFTEHLLVCCGEGVLGVQTMQMWFLTEMRAPIFGLGDWEANRRKYNLWSRVILVEIEGHMRDCKHRLGSELFYLRNQGMLARGRHLSCTLKWEFSR